LAALSGDRNIAMVPLKELTPLTGYVRGGCSPIGGKKNYPVFIYEDALNRERVSINAGARGLLFVLSPEDLIRATGAVAGNIAR
jgi:Cys-tRNA(Pro)/Cys-tRNA(Cys) deacylase